jgi:hypothetical protein
MTSGRHLAIKDIFLVCLPEFAERAADTNHLYKFSRFYRIVVGRQTGGDLVFLLRLFVLLSSGTRTVFASDMYSTIHTPPVIPVDGSHKHDMAQLAALGALVGLS